MEDFICSQLEECRIEFREEMRELQQHTKSQFGDIKSQFDEVTGKLDAIIQLLPDWLRRNGIEPVDRIVVPSDQVTSNLVDDLLEVNQSLDSDLNCVKVSVTTQSWIDCEVHRAKNDGSTCEEISEEKEAAVVAFHVFDEMTEPIREELLEEYTKSDMFLDGTFGDVQPIEEHQAQDNDSSAFEIHEIYHENEVCKVYPEMSMSCDEPSHIEVQKAGTLISATSIAESVKEKVSGPYAYHIFDEMTPMFQAEVMNEPLMYPYIRGINVNNITLFDPGGDILYAMSCSGGMFPGLCGIAHGTCDNGVEGAELCKFVMKGDTYNAYNEMPKSKSTSKGFNDGVRYGKDTQNEVATQGSNGYESHFIPIPNEQNLKTLQFFKQEEYESQLHCMNSQILLNYSQVYGEFSAYNHLLTELCCCLFEWAKSMDSKMDWVLSMWNSREVLLWNCSVPLWRCIIAGTDISRSTLVNWIKRLFSDFHDGALAQRCITYDHPVTRLNYGHDISSVTAKAHFTTDDRLCQRDSFGDEHFLSMLKSDSNAVLSLDSIAHRDGSSESLFEGANSMLMRKCLYCWTVSLDSTNELEFVSSFESRISVLSPLRVKFSWDPGICAIFGYILEDKDVIESVGKDIILIDVILLIWHHNSNRAHSLINSSGISYIEVSLVCLVMLVDLMYLMPEEAITGIIGPISFICVSQSSMLLPLTLIMESLLPMTVIDGGIHWCLCDELDVHYSRLAFSLLNLGSYSTVLLGLLCTVICCSFGHIGGSNASYIVFCMHIYHTSASLRKCCSIPIPYYCLMKNCFSNHDEYNGLVGLKSHSNNNLVYTVFGNCENIYFVNDMFMFVFDPGGCLLDLLGTSSVTSWVSLHNINVVMPIILGVLCAQVSQQLMFSMKAYGIAALLKYWKSLLDMVDSYQLEQLQFYIIISYPELCSFYVVLSMLAGVVWDPDQVVMSFYILERKDVSKRVQEDLSKEALKHALGAFEESARGLAFIVFSKPFVSKLLVVEMVAIRALQAHKVKYFLITSNSAILIPSPSNWALGNVLSNGGCEELCVEAMDETIENSLKLFVGAYNKQGNILFMIMIREVCYNTCNLFDRCCYNKFVELLHRCLLSMGELGYVPSTPNFNIHRNQTYLGMVEYMYIPECNVSSVIPICFGDTHSSCLVECLEDYVTDITPLYSDEAWFVVIIGNYEMPWSFANYSKATFFWLELSYSVVHTKVVQGAAMSKIFVWDPAICHLTTLRTRRLSRRRICHVSGLKIIYIIIYLLVVETGDTYDVIERPSCVSSIKGRLWVVK